MPIPLQYALISAFTADPFCGNPAAIVFLDPHTPLEILTRISSYFNQPMTVFVSPTSTPSHDPEVLEHDIRFIAPRGEDLPICGHATLASAKALFDRAPEAHGRFNARTIQFNAYRGATLRAKKLDDGFIEIQLPSTTPGDIPESQKAVLTRYVNEAFGRPVVIRDMKHGGETYPQYLLVELDESEELAKCIVDAEALRNNGFLINAFTSRSTKGDAKFVSRMFSPIMLTSGEDPVCGSMHGVLTPFWHEKQNIVPGTEIQARQVSSRGGDLRVVWDQEAKVVKLRGQCAAFATGTLVF